MKKQLIAGAFCALMATTVQADNVIIKLTNGTTVTYSVDEVSEISFEETIDGSYNGTQTIVINNTAAWTYVAESIAVTITANADGTINVSYPEYTLPGTMMGDLTLGAVTVSNIPYDESKNAYYLDYGSLGLTQHFKCVTTQGVTSMDSDYVLGTGSAITVEKTDSGLKITNPFKLGKMPFPLVATFEGTK